MKFVIDYFKHLNNEIDNSPAFLLVIWAIIFISSITSITGFMSIIWVTLCAVMLFLSFKRYRRKY